MPITKEFLSPLLQGVEKADDIVNAVIAEYEKEKLPILKNRDDILAERNGFEKKHKELQEAYKALETANKDLNEKLESGIPDKEKKIYQEEIENLKRNIKVLTEENGKKQAEYENSLKALTDEKTNYIVGEEFAKLLNENTAIKPAMREGLTKRYFADYPKSGFSPYDFNGKIEYVTQDGKKMRDILADFFNTDEGKNYLLNQNNGGGASGGATTPAVGGGMKRKDLEALPYAERNAYLKGGGKVID